MHPLLLLTAAAHGVVAVACLVARLLPARTVMGVHPALKPFKFAVSIALFLLSMGMILPCLSVSETTRAGLAWLFASTMVVEMIAIVAQALRGTTSHFNVRRPLDKAFWNAMFVAIVLATVGIVWVALAAMVRPLLDEGGRELPTLLAVAWRGGLILLLLAPLSGFAMGGRLRHSVGGEDGGPGLPLTNWSVRHGDLRVSHFFALHAVQLFPLVAWALLRTSIPQGARFALLLAVVGIASAITVGTLVQAFAGHPIWRAKAPPSV
ncbi:MAG: hypothetical protein HOO96_14315 [Polyangiaceae bacterium]|nr:hypothetical protein [Polyangiaceae bacterium]